MFNNKIKISNFQTLYDLSKAKIISISRKNISFCVTNYGCTITSLKIRGKNNKFTDVVLGFNTLTEYIQNPGSFGAIIGRYSNKIKDAQFSLNGKTYSLLKKYNNFCLHGGFPRWEQILWDYKIIKNRKKSGILFYKTFEDGFQGFPGNLKVQIEYSINDKCELSFIYSATCDQETPISITNHSYFNLSGGKTIDDNELTLFCDKYLEIDKDGIPTGKILNVENSIFDFRKPKKLGLSITEAEDTYGFDHCFVTKAYNEKSGIPNEKTEIVKIAELVDKNAEKKMTVFTNQEGVQFYTMNYIKFLSGKNGNDYSPHNAICLETQSFPDSPNQKDFPCVILKPDQVYKAKTIYKFENL